MSNLADWALMATMTVVSDMSSALTAGDRTNPMGAWKIG